jgi:hypothetical protein
MSPPTSRVWLAVVALASIGLTMRIAGFTNSLWLDEFGTLWTLEGNLRETWHRAITFHGQTPFYYLLAWVPVHALGESEASLRLLSLASVCAATLVIWRIGVLAHGSRAGLCSAALFWLCVPAVVYSANARPYALAMLTAAIAILGFTRASIESDFLGRTLWIVGAVTLIWTHFVEALLLVGLGISYFCLPALRTTYRPRAFITDALVIAFLALTTGLQLADLLARREALSWVSLPDHVGLLGLAAPFALAMVSDMRVRRSRPPSSGLRGALALAAICHVLLLELLLVIGVDLVVPRYAVVIVVPCAILAGLALARLPTLRALVPGVLAFVLLSAAAYLPMLLSTHNFTGAGVEDWRDAVDTLVARLGDDRQTPVLFRAGFVEQDLNVRRELVGATRAPLRSPGRTKPAWNIVDLTYRWEVSGREQYFSEAVAPRLAYGGPFYLLSPGRSDSAYVRSIEQWIDQRWPSKFRRRRLEHDKNVQVILFEPIQSMR